MSTTARAPHPVTVGVDSSRARTETGVRHGIALARMLDVPLSLVHASALPFEGVAFTPYEVTAAREEATDVLARAATLARYLAPDVPVQVHPVLGSVALALETVSKDSSMVIVVRRDASIADRLLSGSTSSRIATRAACPVMVVPCDTDAPAAGPVVVAIDADSPSHGALTFAFARARHTHADLVVLHATARGGTEQGRRAVGETVAGWREDYPEVEVTTQTVESSASDACASAAQGARLLVLGRHRTTGHRMPWTRSVAKAVLAHTACPVVTVPHDAVDLAYHPRPRAMQAPVGPVY
ncbi:MULTISPECIES: universal stress protein [Mumia]|uniref:universal stress protein n=1 Tax=Mumia TaxID=1546255 RepID=UPI00141DA165|nr:universal stress protein [Mumia sp. ZJ430]